MKTLQNIILGFAVITLFASCQSGTDVKQVLSKQETRQEIMKTIANDSTMSVEMMQTMMLTENHGNMMKIMGGNHGMMENMMDNMMEISKNDSGSMSLMYKTMMKNQVLMQKMMGNSQKKNQMQGMF